MWVRFVCVSYKLVNLLRNRTFEPLMRSSFFPPLNTRYWYEILMASGVKLIMMKLVSFPWAIIIHFQLISRQWPFIYNFLSTKICILFRNYVRHILEKIAFCHVIFRDRPNMCSSLFWAKFVKNWQFYSISPFQTTNTVQYRNLRWCLLRLKSEFSEHLCNFLPIILVTL